MSNSLAETIRAWRERLPPSALGLPTRHAARTKGLRREDLAELAQVSVDYVVRLEQGRAASPSPGVVSALARALHLSVEERDHLFRLAGLLPPAADAISDHIPPGVQRIVTRLVDVPCAVFAPDWQLLSWNRHWTAVLGDPRAAPPALRNFARDTFPIDAGRRSLSYWPVTVSDADSTAAAIVADLRKASVRFPDDARLRKLVGELRNGNRQFSELWAGAGVNTHREDHKTIHHPLVGAIEVDCDVLGDGDGDLKIVVLTAAPGSEDETKMRLCAVNGAVEPEVLRP